MAQQKTWAVIDSRTRKAICMGRESLVREMFAHEKRRNPKFKGSVRQVSIPADHSETGSFWEKKF